ARSRYGHRLALEALAACLQHLVGEVHATVARRLGTNERAAPAEPLAGEHPFERMGQLLVLTEEVPDFAPADADVSRRHVDVGADVPIELVHEALAKPHHFIVGFPF